MNVDDVRARVEHIKAIAVDDEEAHAEQDKLWLDVLQAIADGADNPVGLAAVAITASDVEFSRWYA